MASSQECPICFDALTAGSSVVPRCGHMFHESCLEDSMKISACDKCPVCRAPLRSSEFVPIFNGLPDGEKVSPQPSRPIRPTGQRRRKLLRYLPERVRLPRIRNSSGIRVALARAPREAQRSSRNVRRGLDVEVDEDNLSSGLANRTERNAFTGHDSGLSRGLISQEAELSLMSRLADRAERYAYSRNGHPLARRRDGHFQFRGFGRSLLERYGPFFGIVGMICIVIYIFGWGLLVALPALIQAILKLFR